MPIWKWVGGVNTLSSSIGALWYVVLVGGFGMGVGIFFSNYFSLADWRTGANLRSWQPLQAIDRRNTREILGMARLAFTTLVLEPTLDNATH